jgi:hypothetical protein
MNRKIILIILSLVVALGIGCRSSLVHNVENSAVSLNEGQKLSMEEIGKAITVAGAGLGWRMKAQGPGHMVGTLSVRSHIAVVDVKYNTETYSITYKDSSNLNHTEDGYIHSNYNGWVQNLEKAINSQLAIL